MQFKGRPGTRRNVVVALIVVAAVALASAPTGNGYQAGITSSTVGAPVDFRTVGCSATDCHSGQAFATGSSLISWTIVDEAGDEVAGRFYEHDAHYTITITLDEQNAPDASNHAGFNLFASAGELGAVSGSSRVSDDHKEATHVDAGSTEWQISWTAPDEGAVVFDLFVNDVDGNALSDETDTAYAVGWWLTDDTGALPGTVSAEEDAHVGVPLPQYWIGLTALASTMFILLFGFAYLKYVSPHSADQKDR